MFKRRKKIKDHEIYPDEIFLDSSNLPEFDTDQFEGRLEQPVSKRAIYILILTFFLIGVVFFARAVNLQVVNGETYADQSENNRLKHTPIFPERGVVFDRNKTELAWNVYIEDEKFLGRGYIEKYGFSHILGYVKYPKKDSAGFYFQEDILGIDGIELEYNGVLGGQRGVKITEVDAFNEIQSENTILAPQDGVPIALTIDSGVQEQLYKSIDSLAGEIGFSGGAGVIMDVRDGSILALASFPEYSSIVLSGGSDTERIAEYVKDTDTPFLNRAISGLYTPGSTIKPFLGIAALAEGIISPTKQIFSSGSIAIENPYFPDLESVFNDWKAHGWVDLRGALAVSSNVYFFSIGGGYEDQEGLGIKRIEKYTRIFGLGKETGIDLPGETVGVIPNPTWKEKYFPGDPWRLGDTYNTSIGQYGFQITPIALVRGIAAIANGGKLLTPHIVNSIGNTPAFPNGTIIGTIPIDEEDFSVVREGMRQGVTDGISRVLDLPYVNVAAKTGTAEVGTTKKRVNSWISGFFPYETPRYAFVVVMEKGPRDNLKGAVFVMRQVFEWMAENTPQYLN